ncbi:TSUP family transporter [Streptomyces sp. S1D4-11]
MSAFVLALVAGALVGLALGALGGGGSVLAVPALIYLLGFTPAAATTASLLIVTATSLTALFGHARSGHVRWRAGCTVRGRKHPAGGGGRSSVGPAAAAAADRRVRRRRRPGRHPYAALLPGNVPHGARRGSAKALGTGAGLGALTGLLGVGGGFLAVLTLVTVLAFEMQAAIGTSLLIISVNSLASLLTRGATTSGLDWTLIAPSPGPRSWAPGTANAWPAKPRAPSFSAPSPWSCWRWPRSCSSTP